MSGVGSQTGGFTPQNLPSPNQGPKPAHPTAVAIKTVGPQTTTPVTTKNPEAKPEEIVEKVLDQKQDAAQIHKDVAKQRAGADSFQARTAAGTSREATQHGAKFAGNLNEEKELARAKREEFVNRVQNSKLMEAKAGSATDVSDPEAPQKEQAVANAAQAEVDSVDPDEKEKNTLEFKLEQIRKKGGGVKGDGFIAFVRREMDKGPLPESIMELVDGFLETLRGTALTASEMISEGNEPLITLRGIVAADNVDEQVAMQGSLAKSVVNSAGERSDLMVVRNLLQAEIKLAPPKPLQGTKPNKIEKAVEFVSSINKGNLFAPWDSAAMQAA